MKKTCFGCAALYNDPQAVTIYCHLEYKMDRKNVCPLEECPKPRTIKAYVALELNKPSRMGGR